MANQNNPGDTLGTPNKYGGMTSVEGYSAGATNAFSAGIVSGFRVYADNPLGMSVRVGGETAGSEAIKDVALLTDNGIGDRHVVFNRNNTPIKLTIPPAPTANSRLDAIVLYKDMTVEGDSDTTDNPGSVGIVVVSGDVAATPQLPNAAKIRSVLPNGTTTLYQMIASVQVTSGASLITDANINDIRQRSYLTRELISCTIPSVTSRQKSPQTFEANGVQTRVRGFTDAYRSTPNYNEYFVLNGDHVKFTKRGIYLARWQVLTIEANNIFGLICVGTGNGTGAYEIYHGLFKAASPTGYQSIGGTNILIVDTPNSCVWVNIENRALRTATLADQTYIQLAKLGDL